MKRILVVDDEPSILKFLVRVLEREGYTVYAAANGEEALRVLNHIKIDLLLSDIKMQGVDGVQLLKEAQQNWPDLAIILLTGHATIDSAVAAVRHGAVDYLIKPIKNEAILQAVEAGLAHRAREQRRNQLEVLASDFAKVLGVSSSTSSDILEFEGLQIHKQQHLAFWEGQPIALTPTEYRLLLALCESPGATLEYVHLVNMACGYFCDRHEAREIIGTHVRNLRLKLTQLAKTIQIESIRSIGYRLAIVSPDSL
jgi:DNA-binding response OmpR family regulator